LLSFPYQIDFEPILTMPPLFVWRRIASEMASFPLVADDTRQNVCRVPSPRLLLAGATIHFDNPHNPIDSPAPRTKFGRAEHIFISNATQAYVLWRRHCTGRSSQCKIGPARRSLIVRVSTMFLCIILVVWTAAYPALYRSAT